MHPLFTVSTYFTVSTHFTVCTHNDPFLRYRDMQGRVSTACWCVCKRQRPRSEHQPYVIISAQTPRLGVTSAPKRQAMMWPTQLTANALALPDVSQPPPSRPRTDPVVSQPPPPRPRTVPDVSQPSPPLPRTDPTLLSASAASEQVFIFNKIFHSSMIRISSSPQQAVMEL